MCFRYSLVSSVAFASPLRVKPFIPSTVSRINQSPCRGAVTYCTIKRQKTTHAPQRPSISPAEAKPSTSSLSDAPKASLSFLLLNFVTVLWGTQHAVIKLALQDTPPATLNLSRFLIAALISLPSLPRPSRQTLQSYLAGAELSLYLFLGYALQSVSLLTTSASRSGFLLYLNVKLVPLFALFLYRRPIAPLTWGSAAMALFGTALLTYDGAPPSIGDLWSVLAAAASAMFILRLESAAKHPPEAINAISLTSVSILCAAWSFITQASPTVPDVATLLPSSSTGIAAVLYLGIVTTAFSNYLQTIGQRNVPAERAAVIFAMDPVYGAFFASAMLRESLGSRGITGATIIAIAAVLSNRNVSDFLTKKLEKNGQWLQRTKSKFDDRSKQQ